MIRYPQTNASNIQCLKYTFCVAKLGVFSRNNIVSLSNQTSFRAFLILSTYQRQLYSSLFLKSYSRHSLITITHPSWDRVILPLLPKSAIMLHCPLNDGFVWAKTLPGSTQSADVQLGLSMHDWRHSSAVTAFEVASAGPLNLPPTIWQSSSGNGGMIPAPGAQAAKAFSWNEKIRATWNNANK